MKEVMALVSKDLKADLRNKYPVLGILLYLSAIIMISYMSFMNFIKPEVWNALFWLIILFTSVNAIAKSFIQEENRTTYFYFIASPIKIIAAKLLYSNLYQLVLILLSIVIYSILLGAPEAINIWFYINLFCGSIGLASAFTMVSSLASKTENNATLMAILGFPIVIPILLMSTSISKRLILGAPSTDITSDLLTLLSVNVIIIALSFILFPFTWKS
ncbi:MAG: heme exporter protein CcmB [Bacteroidota bacterium]